MTVSVPLELPGIAQMRPEAKNITRLIVATSIGNALEWYDITVYGYFAAYLSKAFFPNSDPTISIPLTFGTFVIAFMPTYETIGLLAPIAVLAARLVQGFSAGGEFGSSTAFLVEHAPGRRGFIASWQFASQGLSTLLASAFGVGLTSWLTPADMQSWGWRIPFLFGILVGPVGIYIRNHLEDATPPPAQHASPIKEVLLRQKFRVLLGIGAIAISTAVNYLIIYMPTYAVKTLNLPPTVGFVATFAAGLVLTFLTPIAGIISDKVGRTSHMIVVSLLLLV